MERVLRELIDLQKVKTLEQSECQNPGEILGAHMEKVGCMISAYLPDAKQVSVEMDGEMFPMERVDSEGFFAIVLVDQMRLLPYKLYIRQYPLAESNFTSIPQRTIDLHLYTKK